jgi:hypothetical protein
MTLPMSCEGEESEVQLMGIVGGAVQSSFSFARMAQPIGLDVPIVSPSRRAE